MTTITSLPPAPSRSDPTTFSDRSDALLGALDGFVSETNTVAGEVIANKNASATSATAAAGSATTATTQAGIATTQAGLATTQANTATTQAGIATTQAGLATTQANTATTQAGIATTQAGTATTQAGIATTKADEANSSAIDAAASAASIAGGPVASVNGRTGVVTGVQDSLVAGTDYVSPTGSDGTVTRQMLKDCGQVYYDSSTTNALDYVNGACQRWAPNTGAQTLTISNWPPTGNLGELLIQGINLGAATITWPTINWVKSDGTTTTTFSSNGVTLQSSGTDWVFLWTRDAGTTIYGKVVR